MSAKHLAHLPERGRWPRIALAILVVNVAVIAVLLLQHWTAGLGALLWSGAAWTLWLLRPGSLLQRATTNTFARWQRVLTVVLCAVTVVACTWPMSLSKTWTGDDANHGGQRNEYEVLADALLEGKVTVFDGEDTSALQALNDPYDPFERAEKNVGYHFDYAYYHGKYYVYFGIVPALLVFAPYRALTGEQLTGYRATQLFTALFIVALFALFLKLLRAFKLKMPFGTYLLLCVVCSVICVLCAMETPSLYCTAVNSAMAFQFWSLYFLIDAVYCREGRRSQVPVAMVGTLCGALVFGCRPNIGLMNVLAIPLLIHYLRGRKASLVEAGKLCLVALPYAVVGAGLMWYNLIRFGSLTDFGATYQLTAVNVAWFVKDPASKSFPHIVDGLRAAYIESPATPKEFPFVTWGGMIVNYPILLYCLYVFQGRALAKLRECGLLAFTLLLAALPVVLSIITTMWSPLYYERYRMDLYPSLVLLLFIAVALTFALEQGREQIYAFVFGAACVLTLCKCLLLFCVPYDLNWATEIPERLQTVWRVLTINHLLG